MVFVNLLFFAVGLFFLVSGSGFFVKSGASIAKKLGVSEFVIGLTLIALGTSLPELISSVLASFRHESGLVIGTIIGANIANIGLMVGVASLIGVLKTKQHMLSRDGFIMLLGSFLVFIFIFNGVISRLEGVIFFLLYISYSVFLFETKPEYKGRFGFREFLKYFFRFEYLITIRSRVFSGIRYRIQPKEKKKLVELFELELFKDIIILIIGGFLLYYGAEYVVEEGVFFAGFFNVPKTVIGIFIAIGTTMPEMSVSIAAARRGLGNIVLGNAIGSCITNVFLILGVSSLIHPLSISHLNIVYTAPFLVVMSVLFLSFIRSGWRIRKAEGIVLLSLYLFFLVSVFFVR